MIRIDLVGGQCYHLDIPAEAQMATIETIVNDECDRHILLFPGEKGGTVAIDIAQVVAAVSTDLKFEDIPRTPWIEA